MVLPGRGAKGETMATRNYQTLTRPDSVVVAATKEIDADLGLGGASQLNIVVINGIGNISSTISALDGNADVAAIAKNNTAVAHSFTQTFAPPPFHNSWWTITRTKDGPDSVQIEVSNSVDAVTAAKFIAAVQRHISGTESSAGFGKLLGSELAEFYRKREASVLRLEELTQKLIQQNEAYRRDLDKESATLRQKLEEEKASHLQNLQKQFEEKDAVVKDHEQKLRAREEELDDRASRHVRRQIRKDFLEKLASREKQFTLSQSTNEKRRPIHWQFGLLLLISLVVALSGLWAVAHAPNDISAIVRVVLGVVGVAGSTIYYIRWSDSWFRQHADEEFRLQRLALDFDRASWVVEMALEWKQEKEGEFPRELVEKLTANLFAAGNASEAQRHPAEELAAALLGASSSLKLPIPGGGELNVDRKGIKSLG
jgi:hypothetical protein